jgi:transcriptional regulator with XRE-family HTH domain
MSGRSLVERVVAERQRRGLTIRQAAGLTDITNTTWSRWENDGGVPSPKLRTAVATAFGWGQDWPENPPPLPVPTDHGVTLPDLDAKLERIINAQVDARVIGRTTAADATLAVTEALERLAHEVAELRRLVAQPAAAGRAHRRTDPTQ